MMTNFLKSFNRVTHNWGAITFGIFGAALIYLLFTFLIATNVIPAKDFHYSPVTATIAAASTILWLPIVKMVIRAWDFIYNLIHFNGVKIALKKMKVIFIGIGWALLGLASVTFLIVLTKNFVVAVGSSGIELVILAYGFGAVYEKVTRMQRDTDKMKDIMKVPSKK